MISCKIKLNFIVPDNKHYINFVIANPIKVYRRPDSKILNKKYLIGTRILLKNHKVITITLDSFEGVKFKYIIRKYMKENWKVKVKNITIKHINNSGNNHNYMVLVKKCNKILRNIKHSVSDTNPITWKIFYETYTHKSEKELIPQEIYNTISTIIELNYSCKIDINGEKTNILKIYKIISQII